MKFLIFLSLLIVSNFAVAGNYGKFKMEFSNMAGFDYSVEFLLNSKHKVKEIESSDYISIYATKLGTKKILTIVGPVDEDFVRVRLHLENNLLYLNSSLIKLYRWSKSKREYVLLEANNSDKDTAICMSSIIQGYEDLEN